jgi:opacity protein-like surface antigen
MKPIPLALVLFALMPSAALGQEVIGFTIGGGPTLSRGDGAETHGRGINLGATTSVPLSPRLTVGATVGYQDIRLIDDEEARRRGHDPETFRLGGGFVDGGDRRALGLLAHGQFHLLPNTGTISPYVLAGAGLTRMRVTDTEVYFLGQWDTEPGNTGFAAAADVGGGVQVRVSQVVALFAQGSYLRLFDDDDTTMVPIHAGLLIEWGRE